MPVPRVRHGQISRGGWGSQSKLCTNGSPRSEPDGDVELAYTYADHTTRFLDEQLLKGGLRLAGLLDWILGERQAPPPGYRQAAAWLDEFEGWSVPFISCPSPQP